MYKYVQLRTYMYTSRTVTEHASYGILVVNTVQWSENDRSSQFTLARQTCLSRHRVDLIDNKSLLRSLYWGRQWFVFAVEVSLQSYTPGSISPNAPPDSAQSIQTALCSFLPCFHREILNVP